MIDFDKIYFKSKTVGKLSSKSLEELKSTLMDIDVKKSKIRKKISSLNTRLRKANSALSWVNWFPLL